MAGSKTSLLLLRSLSLLGTFIILTLGIWSLIIIRGLNERGKNVLSTYAPELGPEVASWSRFIAAGAKSGVQTQVLVIASSTSTFIMPIIIFSNRYYWLRIPPAIVLLIELTSTLSTVTTFGSAFSLSLNLSAFTASRVYTLDSADLSFFALLNPLSMALAITSALTVFFSITAVTAHILDFLKRRAQSKDTRSFEPSVSALGMRHGVHSLHPHTQTYHAPVPTTHDPFSAFRNDQGARPSIKHVSFANEAVWSNRKPSNSRWSASTASPRGVERDIMKLLDVKRARRAVPVRPARPWSTVQNGRDGGNCV